MFASLTQKAPRCFHIPRPSRAGLWIFCGWELCIHMCMLRFKRSRPPTLWPTCGLGPFHVASLQSWHRPVDHGSAWLMRLLARWHHVSGLGPQCRTFPPTEGLGGVGDGATRPHSQGRADRMFQRRDEDGGGHEAAKRRHHGLKAPKVEVAPYVGQDAQRSNDISGPRRLSTPPKHGRFYSNAERV